MAGTHFDIWSYFHFSHSEFLNTSDLSQLSLFVFSKPAFYLLDVRFVLQFLGPRLASTSSLPICRSPHVPPLFH